MTKLVEAIAKSLVDNPEGVVVTESEGRQGTVIELRVAPEDMGKVIGRQPRRCRSHRNRRRTGHGHPSSGSTRRYGEGHR